MSCWTTQFVVMMPPIIVSHGPAWAMIKVGQQHLRRSSLFYANKGSIKKNKMDVEWPSSPLFG